MISDVNLRLKCLDLITRNSTNDSPIYQMIQAEMLANYVRTGKLPTVNYLDAGIMADTLLQKSLDQILQERNQSHDPTEGSNDDPDALIHLESPIRDFLRKLRFVNR